MTRTFALVTTLVLLAASLGAPVALGGDGWLAGGGRPEPNTRYDSDAFMFGAPNTEPVDRVYFNGLVVRDRFPSTYLAPDGSTFIYEDTMTLVAALGSWRDCNGDGYVGAKVVPASYGSWSAYPASAAPGDVDTRLCPVGGAYHDGLIVDEFRWIGPGARSDPLATRCVTPEPACVALAEAANDVHDPAAVVWGDLGFPDGPAFLTGPLLIRGQFNDSSSTVDRFDRMFGGLVENQVDPVAGEGTWDSKPTVGACPADGERRLFAGPGGQCGLYPLWQAKRLVNDSDAHDEPATPLVTAFDTTNDAGRSGSACDDTTLPGGIRAADVDPAIAEDPLMHGSAGGTFENAHAGTGGFTFSGECAPAEAPNLEGDESPTPGKAHADARLRFHPATRAAVPALGVANVPTDAFGVLGGPTSAGGPGVGPWRGGARWVADTPILRHNGGALTDPRPVTFYADVGPLAVPSPAVALPAGVQDAHAYGAPQCAGDHADTPGNRAPNADGWVCSLALWERDVALRVGAGVLIGAPFDLRDVDCYDFGVSEDAEIPRVVVPATDRSDAYVVRESCAVLMG